MFIPIYYHNVTNFSEDESKPCLIQNMSNLKITLLHYPPQSLKLNPMYILFEEVEQQINHWCAVNKHGVTVRCYRVNMDKKFRGFQTSGEISVVKNKGSSEGKQENIQAKARCTSVSVQAHFHCSACWQPLQTCLDWRNNELWNSIGSLSNGPPF